MYCGVYERKVDPKGRLQLPQEYVNSHPIHMTISSDSKNSTFLYATGIEEVINNALDSMGPLSEKPVISLQPDSNRRILLPSYIRKHIQNENRQSVIIGQGNHFSIYSPENAEKLLNNL